MRCSVFRFDMTFSKEVVKQVTDFPLVRSRWEDSLSQFDSSYSPKGKQGKKVNG